jgi:tetrahydromethanopterin S-methyltransferase subunit A
VLDRMFSAADASCLYRTAIEAHMVSRLDHAAYLGRELTRAEDALQRNEDYVQDRAPGDMSPADDADMQQNNGGCGCQTRKGESCK